MLITSVYKQSTGTGKLSLLIGQTKITIIVSMYNCYNNDYILELGLYLKDQQFNIINC